MGGLDITSTVRHGIISRVPFDTLIVPAKRLASTTISSTCAPPATSMASKHLALVLCLRALDFVPEGSEIASSFERGGHPSNRLASSLLAFIVTPSIYTIPFIAGSCSAASCRN